MCVIIIIPKGGSIDKSELNDAWNLNSDGAGYATIVGGQVLYERGFMNFNRFYNAIKHKIGREEIILHFRISTSRKVNKLQTHPYEVGKKESLRGLTTNPVVCMNGTIFKQREYKGYNDTMSYIKDHLDSFRIIGETQSEDLLNIIQDSTGSRWAMMTTKGALWSSDFKEYEGRYYSNLNHINSYTGLCGVTVIPTLRDYLTDKQYQQVKNRKKLYYRLIDFMADFYDCPYVLEDVLMADTLQEIEQRLNCYSSY